MTCATFVVFVTRRQITKKQLVACHTHVFNLSFRKAAWSGAYPSNARLFESDWVFELCKRMTAARQFDDKALSEIID
jgi:hypothetical protein